MRGHALLPNCFDLLQSTPATIVVSSLVARHSSLLAFLPNVSLLRPSWSSGNAGLKSGLGIHNSLRSCLQISIPSKHPLQPIQSTMVVSLKTVIPLRGKCVRRSCRRIFDCRGHAWCDTGEQAPELTECTALADQAVAASPQGYRRGNRLGLVGLLSCT